STTCGLSGGVAYCWGDNSNGQLGQPVGGQLSSPTAVAGGVPFDQISVGGGHVCAIGSGQLWCWGDPALTGTGGTAIGRVGALADWTAISAAGDHSCGISASQGVLCWGHNTTGAIGMAPGGDVTVPTAVALAMPPITIAT